MLRSDSVESEMVNKLIGRADRSELNRLRWEILYLKLFAVDLSMWQAYAARPVREAVWTALERHLATTFAAIPQFTEQVNQRMLLYSQAMKGPSSGVSDAIGAVFVQMTSGSVGELDRRFLAAAVFASTFEKARDVIAKAPTADSRTQ
jgi:hypothetical protein